MNQFASRRVLRCAAVLAAPVIVLSACATTPPPKESLTAASFALEKAEQAGGDRYAPLEVHVARERLSQAESSMTREEYESARGLAEESLVNAQLAEAKAEAASARASAEQLRESIQVLRTEMERSSADR
jgi:Domain of unknown function (DUF4398)